MDSLEGSIWPPELWPGPQGKHCGECGRFPAEWPADEWYCRAVGTSVRVESLACQRWKEGQPEDEALRCLRVVMAVEKQKLEEESKAKREAEEAERRKNWHIHILALAGVVYVIDCPPFTKIGHTSNPIPKRLHGLKGANPFELTLYALIPGPTSLEKQFHKEFSRWHHRLEWFRLTHHARNRLAERVLELGGVVYDGVNAPSADSLLPRKKENAGFAKIS